MKDWREYQLIEQGYDPPIEPCFICGGERVHTRTADDGDRGYDCADCGAQTWDRGLLGGGP